MSNPALGEDFEEELGSYEDINEIKNAHHQNDVVTVVYKAVAGMRLSDGRDGRLWHVVASYPGLTVDEILKAGTTVCLDNEVVCLDNEVVTLPYSL